MASILVVKIFNMFRHPGAEFDQRPSWGSRSFVFSAATRTLPAAWPKESPVMWRLDFHRLWSVVDSILWKHEEDVGPKGQTWSEVFFRQGAVGVCLVGTCRTQLGTSEGTLCSIANLSRVGAPPR